MVVTAPIEPLTPTEFEEQQEAAEADDVEHRIEEFDSAQEWNSFIAATESKYAAEEADSTTRTLDEWENIGKAAGLFLFVILAIRGADAIVSGRGF